MSNALTIYDDGKFDLMQRTAAALSTSGYFNDARQQAQAIVKVMAGAELGIPPFAAMTGIHIIKGKPALGANVIATLIKNDPRYDYRVKVMTDEEVTISFFENGEHIGDSSFTAKDAKKAGTQNMDKFPRNMLFARAISNGARWFTPGIFGGSPVYTPEELGAQVDEDGYIDGESVIIDAVIVEDEPQPEAPQTDKPVSIPGLRQAIADSPDPVKLGFVAGIAVQTGLYNHTNHVLSALRGNDEKDGFPFPDGVKVEMSQNVSVNGALQVFDWLMERKQ